MKKKKEVKYLSKEWEDLDGHLKKFLVSGDQEELHWLRVKIKRLKAMLTLIENTSDKRGLLKGFKPVKEIFKHAGQIRDAHINLQLSAQHNLKNAAFENAQRKIIADGTNEFRDKEEKYLKMIKDSYKHLKKQLMHVKNQSVAAYYQRQLEQIAVNLTVSGFGEEMHTNRKMIKILIYNQKMAAKALNGSLLVNNEYLNKLQSAIGEWHDNVNAAELFATPELHDKRFVTSINRKNAGVKRRITLLADDFLKKATTAESAKQ